MARKTLTQRFVKLALTGGLAMLALAQPGLAADLAQTLQFDIKPQPLTDALMKYSQQSGVQVTSPADIVAGKASAGAVGALSARNALEQLLGGTDLVYEVVGVSTVILRSDSAAHSGEKTSSTGWAASDGGSFRLANTSWNERETGDVAPASAKDQLDEVVVTGAKRKFAPTDSNAATKINMDVIDTPQSITVLSSEFMDIVGVKSVNDAAALAPGVVNNMGSTPLFVDVTARGFNVNVFQGFKINGMPWQEHEPFDFAAVERLEVVRGPASIIYGQSDYGATVNVQLKAPQAKRAFSGELGYGSHGSQRAVLDMTGTLTDSSRVRGRLIVAYDNSLTDQDKAFSRGTTVAPSLSLDITDNTALDVNYLHYMREARFTYGFGLLEGNVLPDVPRNAFIGADFQGMNATMDFLLAKLTHDFGNSWVLAATGAYHHSVGRYKDPFLNDAGGPLPSSGEVELLDDRWHNDVHDLGGDLTLTGDFQALGKTHTLMLNAFMRRNWVNNFGACCQSIGIINIFDPQPSSLSEAYLNFPTEPRNSPAYPRDSWSEYRNLHDAAISSLVLLHPVDRVSAMLGLRYSEFDRVSTDWFDRSISFQNPPDYRNHAVTSRVGLVYEVVPDANVYVSYSDGVIFNPAVSKSGGPLPAETGVQWEVGAKAALFNKKLTMAASAFQIARKNIATNDPLAPPNAIYQITIGGQTHKGIELEAIGEPVPGWNIMGSYSYLDVSITKAPDQRMVGQQLANAPHHMVKLYTTYQLQSGALQGLSLGGGLFHLGKREVDNFGTFKLPAYTRLDLRLSYDRLENVSFALNAFNVTNEKILASTWQYAYSNINYQTGRGAMLSMNFNY